MTTETLGQDKLTQLTTLAEKFTSTREQKKQVEQQLKEINESLEKIQEDMVKLMEDNEIDQIAVHGRIYFPYVQSFPSVLDQDRFYQWLEDRAQDGIIKRTVHPQTLRAWFKDHEDDYAEELIGERMIKVFEKRRVGDRKR